MLMGNIGTHRRPEFYIPQAVGPLRKAVGTGLHHGVLAALIRHFPQEPLYRRRLRRGLVFLIPSDFAACTVLNRGEKTRLFSQKPQ